MRKTLWWLTMATFLVGITATPARAQGPGSQKSGGWELFLAPALIVLHERDHKNPEHGAHMVPKLALDVGVAYAWHNGKRTTTLGLAFGFDSHQDFGPIVVVGDVLWHVAKKVDLGINGVAYVDFNKDGWRAVGIGVGPKVMFQVDPKGVHMGVAFNPILQIDNHGDPQPGFMLEGEVAIDFDMFRSQKK